MITLQLNAKQILNQLNVLTIYNLRTFEIYTISNNYEQIYSARKLNYFSISSIQLTHTCNSYKYILQLNNYKNREIED